MHLQDYQCFCYQGMFYALSNLYNMEKQFHAIELLLITQTLDEMFSLKTLN